MFNWDQILIKKFLVLVLVIAPYGGTCRTHFASRAAHAVFVRAKVTRCTVGDILINASLVAEGAGTTKGLAEFLARRAKLESARVISV